MSFSTNRNKNNILFELNAYKNRFFFFEFSGIWASEIIAALMGNQHSGLYIQVYTGIYRYLSQFGLHIDVYRCA